MTSQMSSKKPQDNQDQMKRIAVLWVKAQPIASVFIRASVRDRHAAEDVLQEVARNVITSFDRYDESRPFNAWVLGISRNCVLRYYRTVSNDRLVFDGELLDMICDSYINISDEGWIYDAALKQCLEKLTGRSRTAIEKRYTDSLSSDEIASEMGMTPVAVRVLLHRVRKALRVCIDRAVVVLRERPTGRPQGGNDA